MDTYREPLNSQKQPAGAKLVPDQKSPVGPASVQPRGYTQAASQAASKQKPSQVRGFSGGMSAPRGTSPQKVSSPTKESTYADQIGKNPTPVQDRKPTPQIRTFKADAVGYMKEKNVTASQIAIAEQKRAREQAASQPVPVKKTRKFGMLFAIIFFLLIGAGIFGVVFFKPNLPFLQQPEPVVPLPPTELTSLSGGAKTEHIELDNTLTHSEVSGYFDRLQRDQATYMFIENDLDGNKTFIFPLSFFEFIRAYELQEVSFAFSQVEYGMWQRSPYVLFEVNDFQKAYPQIFTWEQRMIEQVEPLFPNIREKEVEVPVISEQPVEELPSEEIETESEQEEDSEEIAEEEVPSEEVTTVEKSDEEESEEVEVLEEIEPKTTFTKISWRDREFSDAVYKNQNIRIITDDNKNPLLFYTFINDRYILIGEELELIPEMLKRLNK